jgi:hypothetical protein
MVPPRVGRGADGPSLGVPGKQPGTRSVSRSASRQDEGGMLGFIRKKFVGSYFALRALNRRKVSGW